VGDGTTALSAAAAPVVLERVSTADGSLGVPVLLPLSQAGANQPLTLAGNATSEGALTLSGDGRYVTLAGYAAVPTTAGVAMTSVPRVAARVDAYGTVDTSTSTASSFGGVATVRAAASADGTGFWMSGSSGGLAYLPFGMTVGAVTVLSTSSAPPSPNKRGRHCKILTLYSVRPVVHSRASSK
jgi:hypothetical protein